MTEQKDALDELSNSELALFISCVSKELAGLVKARGLNTLLPALLCTEIASENVLKQISLH